MIVDASNDNESSQVTLPGLSICVHVPVIRGLKRFLTMSEVAEVEDGVVIIDCVAIFYEQGEGGEHYRNKNKFRCWVSRIEKRLETPDKGGEGKSNRAGKYVWNEEK